MATIRTSIQMHNGMTPALRSMTEALNITLSSFEALQTASSNAVNTSSIQAARQELARAETAFNEVEREIGEADAVQRGKCSAVPVLHKEHWSARSVK
ncbi:hypothetical protein [Anaerovirgula multivorans]|uniref:hypothetical protein n=1 Tax=Anaerovirgula multivorans TaxID=312168 RepID=UPI000B778F36|nr:hypothetical protein [Anaerovirgula multivorans]